MKNKIQEGKKEEIVVADGGGSQKEPIAVVSDLGHLTNRKLLNQYLKWVAVLFCALAIFWIGYVRGERHSHPQNESLNGVVFENMQSNGDKSINFSLFWDVWDLLKEKYVDSGKLEAQKLFYGAIKGMLAATGDPYTTFFDPEERKEFGEDISGSFEGIGAELGIKNEILTVIAPLNDTPAEKAGLRAGDKILKIDGKSSSEISVYEAVDKIRGKKGTEVVLTIFRSGEDESREIKIIRDVINVKSVKYETKDGNIAFIRVSRFGEDTAVDFAAAIKKASSQNAKGIILDLRNNPGGYLDASIDMAGRMLPKGKIVVIEENGDGKQKKMTTRGGDVASLIPMVILINEGSASAAEILAGALKDSRPEITLVGKKSFGKGSVQEFIELPQKTAVKITVARWLTPNGKQINEEGISPDVEVELSNEDYQNDRDPQLDKALEIIKGKIK